MHKDKKLTASLVLGSGGARGMAHIGVIHWLEENGYEIKAVAGTSIGSLVGGIYALGHLNDFTKWVSALTKSDIVRLLDFSVGSSGLVKGDRIINTLKTLVGESRIEDLRITYTAVAADVLNEKEVWFSEGSLFDAIRASISLPAFFTPALHDGVELLDGGMLNPVPVAPTFRDKTDITIAVNLAGPPVQVAPKQTLIPTFAGADDLTLKIGQYLDDLGAKLSVEAESRMSLYKVLDQSFDAMQGVIARQKLAAYPPDVTIDIPRNCCGTLEFEVAPQIIQLGYNAAASAMGTLSKQER
ncbi:patatin-like phospholipase family protein [Rhodovibrionaceae bacterium A322]